MDTGHEALATAEQSAVHLLSDRYEDDEVRAWCHRAAAAVVERLPDQGTTYVAVARGTVRCDHFRLLPAMYAALPERALVTTSADAVVLFISAKRYRGMPAAGGPLEEKGRLRYIDGCSDTGLIGPLRQGDPCLNFLHFPPGINQTLHTHPSVRIGLIARGNGLCRSPAGEFPLATGSVFVIPTGAIHAFSTQSDRLDIIAFHPDGVTGPTDEHHQMLDATLAV